MGAENRGTQAAKIERDASFDIYGHSLRARPTLCRCLCASVSLSVSDSVSLCGAVCLYVFVCVCVSFYLSSACASVCVCVCLSAIMVFSIVRIEGIEGTAKPLIRLLCVCVCVCVCVCDIGAVVEKKEQ